MPTFFEVWKFLDRKRRARMPVIVVRGEISEDDESDILKLKARA